MTPDLSAAYQALQQAQQARKAGNKRLARQYAEKAARLAPDNDEVWMMMAALASPRASVVYMEKALQINPESERVRQGLHWAVERLRKETPPSAVPAAAVPAKKASGRPVLLYVAALAACVVLVAAAWYVTPAAAALLNNSLFPGQENVPAWAAVDVAKPTNTLPPAPTQMSVDLGTPVPSATPAATDAPTQANTPADVTVPSDTPLATDIPVATDTPLPSDTPTITPADEASATPQLAADLAAATPTSLPVDDPNYASPTPLPTDTPGPLPTAAATAVLPAMTPASVPNNVKVSGGTRWIDVDLTHQTTYAYEGNTLVNSFVVSTGTWQYPTVTGQYHIYVKYRYKDMSGPGYYLPNVPWTMFFYQGYALHGTYWHSNFGHPMSHGCVNLSIPDAEWLYNWASVGTLVNVHY